MDSSPSDTLIPPRQPPGQDRFLSWTQEDVEQRLGFRGGRFTSVNLGLAFLMAVVMGIAFFALLFYGFRSHVETAAIARAFLERGPVPFPTTLLFFWGVAILFLKTRKLKFQRRTLGLAAVPQQAGFTLTEESARTVLDRVHGLVDHPRHFVLLNRIERALSNLRNFGQISDVASLLRTQAENDEDQVASSFGLLHGMVWAVPVLGFIGTVQGLSRAIGSFGQTLQASGDLGAIKNSLQGVTGGLATGFEITLIALVFALILQLSITFQQGAKQPSWTSATTTATRTSFPSCACADGKSSSRSLGRPWLGASAGPTPNPPGLNWPPPRSDTTMGGNSGGRRGGSGARITFFVFLDIITAVTGILIFVVLLLALRAGDDAGSSGAGVAAMGATGKGDPAVESALADRLRQIESLALTNRGQETALSEAEAMPDSAALRADFAALQAALERERATAARRATVARGRAADNAARDAAAGLTANRAQLETARRQLTALTAENAARRRESETLEAEVKTAEAQLLATQAKGKNRLWLVPERADTTKSPVLVVVAGTGATAERFDRPESRTTLGARDGLRGVLERCNRLDDYVVFYVRPSGIARFERYVKEARTAGFEVGYDAIEEERELIFSRRND